MCGNLFMPGCLPSRCTVLPPPDRVNSEMHSKAMNKQVLSPKLSNFGDTLGSCDIGSLEIHLEAVFVLT